MTDSRSLRQELELVVAEEVQIDASLEDSFAALLEQIGPQNERPDGTAMPMTLEARPGGRWFRDLGRDDGHFWGHVQAIKRPSLLEITGPLFISGPVASNLQYRLQGHDGGTCLRLRHNAFGLIPADARRGLTKGWRPLLGRVKSRAEAD